MRSLLLFVLISVASGCALQPKNRDEFISSTAGGAFGSLVVSSVVDRDYKVVVADLQKKFGECMNYSRSGYEHTGVSWKATQSFYHGSSKAVGPDKTEFTFRITETGRPPRSPDDGLFRAATDVERIGKNKTKVVTYTTYLFGHRVVADAIKSWSEGKPASCPNVM